MGKGILLAVLAATVLSIGVAIGINNSGLTSGETKARDQQSLLAEESARSGLTMTASRLKREFDTWRDGLPVTPYGGGSFVTAVRGPETGPFQVYSAGVVGGVDAQMTAMVARLASAPAALVVQSDSIDVTLSNHMTASGVDHVVDAGEGFGQGEAVRGVWANSPEARDAFSDELGMLRRDRIRGVTAQADIHEAALPGEHAALLAEAVPLATNTYGSSQAFASQNFGSEDSPAIVVVDGDATFDGGGGVGLLYVKGSFRASGDFSWRGVVIVEEEGQMTFLMRDDAEIVGAAYALHSAGVSASGSEDAFVSLHDVPSHPGFGTFTDVVEWPVMGPVTVQTTSSAPVAATHEARLVGSTLQDFLSLANLDGVDLDPSGITNVSYTGPAQMPMLDIRPALTPAGTTSEVLLQFSAALPPGPIYLYIADLDWIPMEIVALNAAGVPLSATTWTKTRSVDLLIPDEGNRTTLTTNASGALLTPSTPMDEDSEVIIDEITIPDPSQIAALRFRWTATTSTSDYAGISVTNESIFEPKGKLNVSLAQRAAVRYSSVEIGRLARPLASVRGRSEIVMYDHRTEMQMDRGTVRRQASGETTYPYCSSGTTYTAATLMELLTEQLDGATAGACP